MIRKLRVKLVAIIMAFVTVILACVMAAVLGLTRATLEHQSLDMMGHIALNPIRVPAPGEEFDGVRLPYFMLSVGEDGTTEPAGGGYYDLSDTEFLQQAAGVYLDNAQKYAAPGTAVRVTLARCGHHRARLAVATQGEAIPKNELQNIFMN